VALIGVVGGVFELIDRMVVLIAGGKGRPFRLVGRRIAGDHQYVHRAYALGCGLTGHAWREADVLVTGYKLG
jgi:hypothetical protein